MPYDFHLLARIEGQTFIANFWGMEGINVTTKEYTRRAQSDSLAVQAAECLEEMQKLGWNQVEIDSGMAALGVAMSDIATWQDLEDEGKIDRRENDFRTRFSARQMEGVLENRATISTPEILYADESTLAEWAAWYEADAREAYAAMCEIEAASAETWKHAGWTLANAKLDRAAWLWWCCMRRRGLA